MAVLKNTAIFLCQNDCVFLFKDVSFAAANMMKFALCYF